MTFFQLVNTSEGLWPFSGQGHIPGPIATRRRLNHTCRVTSVGQWWISWCSLSTSSLWTSISSDVNVKKVLSFLLRARSSLPSVLKNHHHLYSHLAQSSTCFETTNSCHHFVWLSVFIPGSFTNWIILKIKWYVSRIYSDILIYLSVMKWLLHSGISHISFLCMVRAPKMHSQHFQGSTLCGQLPAVWSTGSLPYRKVLQYFPVNLPTDLSFSLPLKLYLELEYYWRFKKGEPVIVILWVNLEAIVLSDRRTMPFASYKRHLKTSCRSSKTCFWKF